MADKKGHKASSSLYNRDRTKLEQELMKRGYKDKDMWVLVGDRKDGKSYNKDRLDEIFDNSSYTIGVQSLENVAMACDVDILTVFDWVRLDKRPEKMTIEEFDLYKKRLIQMDNADRIRWYVSLFCRKKIPIFYILDELVSKSDFKIPMYKMTRSGFIYNNFLKKRLEGGMTEEEVREIHEKPKYYKNEEGNVVSNKAHLADLKKRDKK